MVKLTSKREQLIKDWLGKHEIADYDIKAYFDSSLDLKANMRNIAEQTGIIEPKTMQEALLDAEKTRIHAENEVKEHEMKEIEKIRANPDSELDKFFYRLKDYIEIVNKSDKIHGLVISGSPAIGKTRTVLKHVSGNYVLLSGHITPVQLYLTIMNNSNSLIIIDDPINLFYNRDSYSLLLQALQTEKNRIVRWQSMMLEREDISMFAEFKGKIIIICNEIPKDMEVLTSRCLTKEMKFSLTERLKLMYEFAKTEKVPPEIIDYIRLLANEGNSEQINFRFIIKVWDFYKMNKNWKLFCEDELVLDKRVKVFLELDKEPISVKEKVKRWNDEIGLSRRQYFYWKEKLFKDLPIDINR